ncbi:hypothetical protein HPS57_01150 [Prevotella sp. PINT]|jgi:hypothetical protein|uniref:hypothetical protein n=1 Tax=Palleniella intestinalis TaxID=2736291 RepID=UPI0015521BA6|nr:hypothetical protein [Palleniella intestinalis]NPD80592.1 hypothetical protein [Palleniella intestinalis]
MYYATLSGRAEDDLDFFKRSGAKKTLVKIFDLIDEIADYQTNPESRCRLLSGLILSQKAGVTSL